MRGDTVTSWYRADRPLTGLKAGVVQPEYPRPDSSSHMSALADQVIQRLTGHLHPPLQQCLTDTADRLIRSQSARDREDAAWLQEQEPALLARYFEDLRARIRQPLLDLLLDRADRSGSRRQQRLSRDQMTLLDDGELSLSVAASRMAANAHQRLSPWLIRVGQCLQLNDQDAADQQHPLGVYPISNAYFALISELSLQPTTRQLLLEQFESQVLERLDQLYPMLLASLSRLSPDRQTSAEVPPSAKAPSTAPPPRLTSQPSHQDALALEAFVAHVCASAGEARADADDAESRPPGRCRGRHGYGRLFDQVMKRLRLAGNPAADAPDEVLAREDLDRLRLLSLLFEELLDDPAMNPVLALALVRLQMPVLRTALAEPFFFEDDSHSARRFLAVLIDIGRCWEAPNERDRSQAQVNALINDITRDAAADPGIFDRALPEAERIATEQTRRYAQLRQRLQDQARGQARLQAAQHQVRTHLTELLHQYPVPRVVRQFIEQAWAQVLLQIQLRHGGESPAWRDACDILVELMAPANGHHRHDPAAVPNLLERIEHHLLEAGMNAIRIERQAHALRACLLQDDQPWDAIPLDEVVESEADQQIFHASNVVPIIGSRPNQRPSRPALPPLPEVGTWLIQPQEAGPMPMPGRYQIAARHEDGAFMLLNASGRPTGPINDYDLADALQQGALQTLPPRDLIQDALLRLASTMNDSAITPA